MRFILLLLLLTSVYAAEMPRICDTKHIKFKDQFVILHTQEDNSSDVYLLYNNSDAKIMVNHQKRHPSASAGWASGIDVKNWSAIIVTQTHFSLLCFDQNFEKINCENSLSVCRIKNYTDSGHNIGGTFWLAENNSYAKIISQMQTRGINPVQP